MEPIDLYSFLAILELSNVFQAIAPNFFQLAMPFAKISPMHAQFFSQLLEYWSQGDITDVDVLLNIFRVARISLEAGIDLMFSYYQP